MGTSNLPILNGTFYGFQITKIPNRYQLGGEFGYQHGQLGPCMLSELDTISCKVALYCCHSTLHNSIASQKMRSQAMERIPTWVFLCNFQALVASDWFFFSVMMRVMFQGTTSHTNGETVRILESFSLLQHYTPQDSSLKVMESTDGSYLKFFEGGLISTPPVELV